MESPVWITGVGTISPLGHGYQAVADALLAGRSGVVRVSGFDVSQHPSQLAGPAPPPPCPLGSDPDEFNIHTDGYQLVHPEALGAEPVQLEGGGESDQRRQRERPGPPGHPAELGAGAGKPCRTPGADGNYYAAVSPRS